MTDWALDTGGYFLFRSLDMVMLRIPYNRVEAFRGYLDSVTDAVVAYSPSAADVREELAGLDSGIISREDALSLIVTYLDQADVASTLAIEKEVNILISQLEQLKGRKQRLINDALYARVEVFLTTQQQTLPSRIPSSFTWLNAIDLYRFVREAALYDY